MSLMDEVVITDANREAFAPVAFIFKEHENPIRMLVYGPKGCGKTTLATARGREFDLMSEKKISFVNSIELINYFNMEEIGERFLEQMGNVDILLIDCFQDFYKQEIGPMLCKLLVEARNNQGFETVIFSDVPFEDLDLSKFEHVFDGYKRVEVEPLDDEGKFEFGRRIEKNLHGYDDEVVSLSDDAMKYLIFDYAKGDLSELRNLLKFFITAAEFEPGTVLEVEDLKPRLHQ